MSINEVDSGSKHAIPNQAFMNVIHEHISDKNTDAPDVEEKQGDNSEEQGDGEEEEEGVEGSGAKMDETDCRIDEVEDEGQFDNDDEMEYIEA